MEREKRKENNASMVSEEMEGNQSQHTCPDSVVNKCSHAALSLLPPCQSSLLNTSGKSHVGSTDRWPSDGGQMLMENLVLQHCSHIRFMDSASSRHIFIRPSLSELFCCCCNPPITTCTSRVIGRRTSQSAGYCSGKHDHDCALAGVLSR